MKTHEAADLYFARCAPWDWLERRIVILGAAGEVVHTLDGWDKLVFHQADGGRTVAEFMRMLKARPDLDGEGRPIDPTDDVMGALTTLVDELHVVELRECSDDLDPAHDLPLSERDAVG